VSGDEKIAILPTPEMKVINPVDTTTESIRCFLEVRFDSTAESGIETFHGVVLTDVAAGWQPRNPCRGCGMGSWHDGDIPPQTQAVSKVAIPRMLS
jgi:hypothetical protein